MLPPAESIFPVLIMLINYDIPDMEEQYVHRVGRTGRGTSKGQALAFCSPEERPLLDAIQVYIETEIEELEINKHDYKAILEDTEDVDVQLAETARPSE